MTTRTGLAACAGFLVLFAVTAWTSVLTKSPTFDEPVEALAGWLRLHYGDFRFNFEDPPLWQEWSALPSGPAALRPDFSATEWRTMGDNPPLQYRFAAATLFTTPGVDGAAFINRGRAMMLVVGVLLGVLIACWAWRLGGPIAGVTAAGLFSLDPNFLGHAPLVKNDVAISLCFLGIAFLLWRIGQHLTLPRAAGLVIACAIAANVKFSAVLLLPVIGALLGLRLIAPAPWTVLGRELVSRRARLAPVVGLVIAIAAVTWVVTWGLYRFRFGPSPDPSVQINFDWMWQHLKKGQLAAQNVARGDAATVGPSSWKPDLISRVMRWLHETRLMPEAWVTGFLHTYGTSTFRRSFLLNSLRPIGWRYYFPVAMTLKTPIATGIALISAAVIGLSMLKEHRREFSAWWTFACLAIPPAVYFGSAVQAHANIGLRHVLPVYAFMFVAAGAVAASTVRRLGPRAALPLGGLALLLAAETAHAAPDFIAFFNAAAGGTRNGVNLLGDSNLDWGQDLKQLAAWQQTHPKIPLYLSYFGTVDPAFYGIRYRPLAGNYLFGPPPVGPPFAEPAVFAISASHLQGISIGPDSVEAYAQLMERTPFAVLGGTLYLYDVPPDTTGGRR